MMTNERSSENYSTPSIIPKHTMGITGEARDKESEKNIQEI